MNEEWIVDGLFILLLLLLLPIGYRRGVTREVFVTAGVLAGMTLAAAWARPWGGDFADLVGLRTSVSQFVMSMLFLFGATITVGYGGAAAAQIGAPARWGRIAGALLAAVNGVLIVALALRDVERYLAGDATVRSMEASQIARTLLRDFGWVLVGAALVMLIPLTVGLIIGIRNPKMAGSSVDAGMNWMPTNDITPRKRRLGGGRDGGKVEPRERGFSSATGRYAADAPSVSETMPIAPVETGAWSVDRAHGRPAGTDEWIDVTRPRSEPVESRADQNWGTVQSRCHSCGERLTPEDAFCPRCGRARE